MKYYSNCGGPLSETAKFCENCGAPLPVRAIAEAAPGAEPVFQPPYYDNTPRRDEGLVTVVKVFLILSCVGMGIFLLPLAWCIPMTVSIFRKFKSGEPIGMGLKICTLLFVNLVAGVLLLCMED